MFSVFLLALSLLTIVAALLAFGGPAGRNFYAPVLLFAVGFHIFGPYDGSPIYQALNNSSNAAGVYKTFGWAMVLGYPALILTLFRLNKLTQRDTQKTVANSQAAGNDQLAAHNYERPRYTFKDVKGMEELKAQLTEIADQILFDGKNGILFTGPPGNGKTFMAEAFAGEFEKIAKSKFEPGKENDIQVAFMSVSIANLASRWINQTTEQINDLFLQAADAAEACGACVLFLDEVEALFVDRGSISRGEAEEKKHVGAFLTLLQTYRDFIDRGIVIVAATNYRDQLDSALIREGRIDFKLEISPPDLAARIGLLTSNPRISKEVATRAAKRWEGFSVARIKHVAELTIRQVQKDGRPEATFDDLMRALRESQGCLGLNLPEDTPPLSKLSFDSDLADRLASLARRMTKIEQIESRGGTVPKGVLFYGPPGTGKTAVAKALAKSSGWAFLATTGQALMSSTDELTKILDKASDIRPCIVFIDEADDILADRDSNPYNKSATNNLLAALDGTRPLQDVMFVAATNYPETLDAAAIRGGRLAEMFEFTLPSTDALLAIVVDFMKFKSNAPWSRKFKAEDAAKILDGLSPADAKDRLQKAINRVVSSDDPRDIELSDLEAVL